MLSFCFSFCSTCTHSSICVASIFCVCTDFGYFDERENRSYLFSNDVPKRVKEKEKNSKCYVVAIDRHESYSRFHVGTAPPLYGYQGIQFS